MPWKPSYPGERPTLGYYAIDWITDNLCRPDTQDYEPLILTREQEEFLLKFYELDPHTGRRVIRRAVLSRPRGWGKSPFVSALCLLEGLAEIKFDGWDAEGQPVGMPWSRIRRPLVQLAAVSDAQVMTNAWPPLMEMVNTEAPVFDNYPGLESFGSYVNLPWGRIEPITASGATAKGAPAVFLVCDQALALDTPIPTPHGWTTMGNLETDDYVIGSDGAPTRVVEAKPILEARECYRVAFSDGTDVVADGGHLWWAKPAGGRYRVTTTRDMDDGRDWIIPSLRGPGGTVEVRHVVWTPSVPVRCIAVEAEDHLFAFGRGFNLTHNTEEWTPGNGGVSLMAKLADNIGKTNGAYIETPNAYAPVGEDARSVAQRSAEAYQAMQEGRARMERGLLYDHREAPATTDLTDRESLTLGLRLAYGDSSAHPDGCLIHDPPCEPGWADHDAHIARIWDPDNTEQNARANFLGQITGTSDAYLDQTTWMACAKPDVTLSDGDLITLGFDGSRGRAKGKPDATAVVGCRVSDGHLFEILVLEAPDERSKWKDWAPDIPLLERTLEETFAKYDVAAFYADPGSDWRSHVNAWEAKYGSKTKHKMTNKHPFEWWMTGGRNTAVEQAVEQFESAVNHRELSHSGPKQGPRLTAHMLNARRRRSHGKLALGKESAASPHKIDAATAAILAWTARLDVVASGVTATRERRVYKAGRLRSGTTERGTRRGFLVT